MEHDTLWPRDLVRRVHEHRTKAVDGFSKRSGADRLVWFDICDDALTAIAREKVLREQQRN